MVQNLKGLGALNCFVIKEELWPVAGVITLL